MSKQQSKVEVSVVVLCGLPGSGKSTVSSRIVDYFSRGITRQEGEWNSRTTQNIGQVSEQGRFSNHKFDKVIHIEYDAITSSLTNQVVAKKTDVQKEGNINNDSFTSEDLDAWRQTRKRALQMLHDELIKSLHGASQPTIYDSTWSKQRILIVMDDNFHLRSMRRDVYKICEGYLTNDVPKKLKICLEESKTTLVKALDLIKIGLSIIHIDTPLDICLHLNEKRKNSKRYIPRHVIVNMAKTLEAPDPQKAAFEACNMNFSSRIPIPGNKTDLNYSKKGRTGNKFLDESKPQITDQIPEDHELFLKELNECVQKAIQYNPILPSLPTKSKEELEEEKRQTSESRAHREDLLLRKLVGITCSNDSSLAKRANMARKNILKEGVAKRSGEPIENCEELDEDDWVLRRFLSLVLGVEMNGSNSNEDKDHFQTKEKIQDAYKEFIQNYFKN